MIDELSNEFVIFYYIISDLVFLVAQALYFSSSFFFSSYFFLNCNKQFLLSIIYLQLSVYPPLLPPPLFHFFSPSRLSPPFFHRSPYLTQYLNHLPQLPNFFIPIFLSSYQNTHTPRSGSIYTLGPHAHAQY